MDAKSDLNLKSSRHLTKEQRLPKCFKDAEKVIKSVKSCQSNFKTVLANSRFRGSYYNKVYTLTLNVLKHYDYIQKIIEEIKLLDKEKLLRREIASIMIYEMLFGRSNLQGESKAVIIIQEYKDDIMRAHQDLQLGIGHKVKKIDIPRYARVHTLNTTVSCVIKDLENCGYQQVFYNEDISDEQYLLLVQNLKKGTFLVDFHFKDLLVFAFNENLVGLQLYQNGHIFLQDKSSYIPVHVLNPEPSTTVLDACAAPGMKSVHIAAKMKNKGILIACERDKNRFETLKEMLQYGDVKNSKVFCKDFKLIDPNDQAYSSVDYILLDPSCSGSGMVNRMDEVTDTEDSKNRDRLQKLAGFQIVLLKHALKFPSVKRVVYSTCSIHEEENEFVVHEALNAFNYAFKLVSVMPEWPERGSEDFEHGHLCLRTLPEKHLTNGFFVAMFERLDGTEAFVQNRRSLKHKKKSLNNEHSRLHKVEDEEIRTLPRQSLMLKSESAVMETERGLESYSEKQVIEDQNNLFDSFSKQDRQDLNSDLKRKKKRKNKEIAGESEYKYEYQSQKEVRQNEICNLPNMEQLEVVKENDSHSAKEKISKHTNIFQEQCGSSEMNQRLTLKHKKKKKHKDFPEIVLSSEMQAINSESEINSKKTKKGKTVNDNTINIHDVTVIKERISDNESQHFPYNSVGNVENTVLKHKRKKHKKSKDCVIDESQNFKADKMLEKCDKNFDEDVIEREVKNKSNCLSELLDCSESKLRKHKKKKKDKELFHDYVNKAFDAKSQKLGKIDKILKKCDKYIVENIIEREEINKSELVCSESISRKHKKKKHKELSHDYVNNTFDKESQNSIKDKTASEKCNKSLKQKEEVDCELNKSDCLSSSLDYVENSSRKHKKKKHKRSF